MSSGGKIFNLRLPFVMALSLVGGVIFAYALSYYNVQTFWYFTAVPVTAVIFVITAIVSKSKYVLLACATCIALFLAGNAYCAAKLYKYDHSEVALDTLCNVTGVVEDVYKTKKDVTYLIIDDAYCNGVKLGGKVLAYLGEKAGEYCDAGDRITFPTTLDKYDTFTYGSLNYRTEQGVKYTCTIYGEMVSEDRFDLFAFIRSRMYTALFSSLSEETASVSYAMLTGNTSFMNENTLNSFRYGGIAHIFAVSGLHIGVLYGVITAIFKRVHGNKYLTAGAKIGIIAFYAGVCGFTPSSVRAVIMCAVAAVCKLTYQKYDSLNALSFAVIILLLINPLYLFGTGFILSVLAVLGIIFLSERYKKLFGGIPQKLNEGIAVSLAAQTTTFPALLLVFGYVSGAGMLLNMIVLPILSMLYVIIFCGAIVCSIFPFAAAYVMPVLCRPLDIVINLALSSGLENSILSGFGGVWLALVLLVVVIAVTDKVNIKLTFRTVTSSLMAVVFSFMVVAESVVPSSTLLVTACAYYGGGMVIVRSTQGTVVVVTEELITNTVFCNLSKNNVKGVDEVIILGGDECLHQYYELNLSVANMYLSPQLISVDSIGDCVVHYQQSFSLYGVNYTLTDSYSLVADYNGATFAVCAGESINVTSADVLYTVYQNTACNADMVVYFNKIDGVYCQYNIYDCGNLHFTAKDGKMIFNQIIPNAR